MVFIVEFEIAVEVQMVNLMQVPHTAQEAVSRLGALMKERMNYVEEEGTGQVEPGTRHEQYQRGWSCDGKADV
jgi:hypothetical protein